MDSIKEPHSPSTSNAIYGSEFALQHMKIPRSPRNIPRIVGWSGVARSGTTALLLLLAGHSKVDRVYFQPLKTIMRFGQPDFELHSEDNLVCMKETFVSRRPEDAYDPIELLLQAGVPPEKITWITVLRDPLQTFGSWQHISEQKDPTSEADPEMFAFWQSHTINLAYKYRNTKVNMIPFTYELLREKEETAIGTLLFRAGLNTEGMGLDFNLAAIRDKLIAGQAADENYFRKFIGATIDHGKFMYKTNSYKINPKNTKKIIDSCQSEYEAFHKLAEREMMASMGYLHKFRS